MRRPFSFCAFSDFFFYTYHRLCHEVDFLWAYHQTHHLTKHPSPALTALADEEQEFLEIFLCPLLAMLVTKAVFNSFTFHEWLYTIITINFTEILGHSGLRIHTEGPAAGPFLRLIGCELTGEDHDLHHRRGWRKSSNYGKQTRLFDVLFGTTRPREEGTPENIDWNLTPFDDVPPE